ncbi:hypothetical protein M407DRAFT_26751 [Tulasnella calospora MUT 4182]|uniref:Uncharacterized protein n=1 Tax=Tulasnella calospora MUT 4182 TaxID=1051891 RepID=A0A0C3LR13_9AGAM|nr:hypothetical protein M407DRAFT_26751 [Tulasnella calospora MUT 4182]
MKNSPKPLEKPITEDFVFTGIDGLNCHQFIKAVRENALKEGKQRDYEWMADFASIRFEEEALRWFESLEDGTQSDWRVLRRAILSRYAEPAYEGAVQNQSLPDVVKFEGRGVEECQIFARWIRNKAQSEGKDENDSWMARLAFQSFTGPALQWYAHLRPDIRKSWSRLELALICQYPYSSASTLSPARIRVLDWNVRVSASESLHSLKSYDQWLAAAKERRAKWAIASDPRIVCWVLVEPGQPIPSNAIVTGQSHCGPLRYSARTWYKRDGLLVGRCGHDLGGARFAHMGKDIWDVKPFEVLVGDPTLLHWVTVPKITPADGSSHSIKHKPFLAVEGGFIGPYATGTATFISQVPMKGHVQAGKAIPTRYNAYVGSDRVEKEVDHVQVLAWAEYC